MEVGQLDNVGTNHLARLGEIEMRVAERGLKRLDLRMDGMHGKI